MFAVLRVQGRRSVRLWLPLFLVWLLLLPLALLLLPFAVLTQLLARISPFRAATAFWSVFAGMRGTRVEVSVPGHSVLVHVY